MNERAELNNELDSTTFRSYYYLKKELVEFCRKNNISTSGGKLELTDRIAHYLDTGESVAPKKVQRKKSDIINITRETLIEEDFVCSQKHRVFFKKEIGNGFSFKVDFQKWLKNNAGKTYEDAINAYYQIIENKKKSTTKIDKQFEYNTYIRDFFADNKGKTLAEAIKCWKYKKQLPGNNRYEESDLTALEYK